MSNLYTLEASAFISKASDTYVAMMDGNTIATMDDFYKHISKALKFPDYFGENLDALDEMLYDLDWLEQSFVLLLISNSHKLLSLEPEKKELIFTLIREIDNPYFEVCLMQEMKNEE